MRHPVASIRPAAKRTRRPRFRRHTISLPPQRQSPRRNLTFSTV